MHDISSSLPFELDGCFGGFVFTDAGKRRMLLRQPDGQDCLLKVPRLLRRRIVGKFRQGEAIRVAGTAERDPESGALKRVVSRVLPDAGAGTAAASLPPPVAASPVTASAATCSVRVCAKKNCWRNGGRALWDALQAEVRTRSLSAQIELRQVGCLDRCKHGPNADSGRHAYRGCVPHDATAIIDRAASSLSPSATLSSTL